MLDNRLGNLEKDEPSTNRIGKQIRRLDSRHEAVVHDRRFGKELG